MPDLMKHVHADLNEQQCRAVMHSRGPLLVAAGPGSGKTKVITHRIAGRILNGDVASQRVLAITFTNRAAEEMRARVRSLVGEEHVLRIGTFHWACHAILRRYGPASGLPSTFRLLSPSEARAVLRDAAGSLPPAQRARLPGAVSAVKNGAPVIAAANRHGLDPDVISNVLPIYRRRLESLSALDLDDILARTLDVLREGPGVLERCRDAQDEILVDEYQDTNPVQQTLLELLAPATQTVVAVGDEDQAIYGWRQADSQGFHRFLDAFPSAKIVRLEESYRSTKRILRAASSLIEHNPDRIGIALRTRNVAGDKPVCFIADDEREEAEWVAARLVSHRERGGDAGRAAVLYRVNAQSRVLEEAFIRHGVPYRVVGAQRFYERPAVQDAIAYLRLAQEDDDPSTAVLAGRVPGIGERRLERLREWSVQEGTSLLAVLPNPTPGISMRSGEALRAIAEHVAVLRGLRSEPLITIVDAAIAVVAGQLQALMGIDQDAALEDLAELRSLVIEMGPRTTLPGLLDRVTLGHDGAPGNGVSLMTLHASKGLEFDEVFVVGLEEGLLPHRRSLDREEDIAEERRLCYVGMTRARRALYLSYAHTRLHGGVFSSGHPSRFVAEIGGRYLSSELSQKRRLKPRLSSVTVGDKVRHPRWMDGVVKRVEGTGRETLVTVHFESGERRLQLCHAPLTLLQGGRSDVVAG